MNGCTGKERDRRGSSSSTGLCVWLSEIRLSSPERDTYEQATEQANAGLLVQNQLVSANFTPLAEECELWYLVEGCASGISSIGRQDGLSFLPCERGLEGYRLHNHPSYVFPAEDRGSKRLCIWVCITSMTTSARGPDYPSTGIRCVEKPSR